MDEWQNRLRAQKEQERQNKNQAKETLQSYRKTGISEEEEQLRKIRLEEQRKKKEATQLLNSYRPNVDDLDSISPKNQQSANNNKKYDGPEPVTAQKVDPRSAIAAGAVSSMAANFDNKNSPTSSDAGGSIDGRENTYSEATTEPVGQQEGEEENNEADYIEKSSPLKNQVVPMENDTLVQSANNNESQSHSDADWVDVKPEEILRSETPEILAEKPLQGHPTLVRLDVDFSFGLISTKAKPILDSYMQAVEEVVQSALDEESNIKGHTFYNPKFRPFVEEIQRDGK